MARQRSNNSFKPNLLRYTNNAAGKACHVVGYATQVGLTQALGAMEIQLDYYDQNDAFGALMPVKGTVAGAPSSDNARQWYVLRLEAPLEYNGVEYLRLLIASRWADHEVGTTQPTSVFILLVPPAETSVPDGFSPKRYEHVAWGMATSVAPNNSFKGMPLRGTP